MKNIYESKAKQYAARHGVPWELASAVINQESRWDSKATSPAGAMGLMQLMPATAKGRGVTDPFDPDQNLNAGMAELGSHLRATKGDVPKALAYYNWGSGNVAKFGMKKAPKETRDYIRIITGSVTAAQQMPQDNGMIKDAYGISVHPKAAEIVADSYAPKELDLNQPGIDEKNAELMAQGAAYQQEQAREQAAIGEATLGDAMRNAWENNITNKLIDSVKFSATPGFKTTDAHKAQLQAAGMYADPDQANAVLAESTSEEMFQDRVATWKENQEFSQKLNNTAGAWKRVGIQAAGIATSFADPALLATGIGVGVAGVRLGAGVVKMAAADVVVGSGISAVAAEGVQQEYTAENAIADTLLVGAFTGVGVAVGKGLDASRAYKAAQRAEARIADEPDAVPVPQEIVRPTLPDVVVEREFDASAEAREILAGFRADADDLAAEVSSGSAVSVARSNFIADMLAEADATAAEFRAVAARTNVERSLNQPDDFELGEPAMTAAPGDEVNSLWGADINDPKVAAKNFGDALDQVKASTKDAVLRTLATKLQSGLNDVQVVLNDVDSTLYQRTIGNLQVAGRVNKVAPVAGQRADLFVQPTKEGVSAITLVHEGTHLATLGATLLRNRVVSGAMSRASLSPNQVKAVNAADALEELRLQYVAELGDRANGVYGLTNVDEFAAEAASEKFRALLASVDAPQPGLLAALKRMAASLLEWLGIKGKTDKADYLTSVFNLMDASGNLRKPEDFKRVEVAPDYSFGGAFLNRAAEVTPQQLQLSVNAQRIRRDLLDAPEPVTKGTEEVSAAVRKWLSDSFGDTELPGIVSEMRQGFMAMGTRGALSESKAMRVIMNRLVEDPTGAAKSMGETAASYAGKLKAEALAKLANFEQLYMDVHTPEEKTLILQALGGGDEVRDRVDTAIFYEMASRRDAANAGMPYVPQDAAAAKVADLLDDVQGFTLSEAAAAGNVHAAKIKSSGLAGWTPYAWSTPRLLDWRNADPAKYNDLLGNLKNQYIKYTLRPALDKLLATGPQTKDVASLFDAMEKRADYLVSSKIDGITEGGSGFDLNRLSFTAKELVEDLQREGYAGQALSDEFQKQLADVLTDRSRHEMNLTETYGPTGTRLMDAMEFDAEGAVHNTINKFSGLAGVARIAGIKDEEDVAALLSVVRADKGVTAEDLEVLRLSLHQLGFTDPKVKGHSQYLTAGLQFVSASMLGKRVFSTMADFAAVAIHSGGLVKATKAMIDGIRKDDALVNQFRELDMEVVGEGWKVDSKNADLDPSGRMEKLNTVNRIGKRVGRVNSAVSMHRAVYGGMRRGVTRLAAAEVISKIAKGAPDTRLAALGITEADAAAIRAAWPGHKAYKQGEALPFARRGKALEPHMLPYELSEKLQTAITRQVDKAMPQSRWVGEQAKFAAEGGNLSAVFMQFLHNSFTAHNKVVIQGMAHDKWSTMGHMVTVGIPVGLALYHLRVAANTIGMSDEERDNYEERALEGQAVVMGVLNSVSAFGMIGTGLSWTDLLMGGMADGSTPAAAIGYGNRLSKAAGAISSAPFDENVTAADAAAATLRVLPAGTTIPATLLYNQMLKND